MKALSAYLEEAVDSVSNEYQRAQSLEPSATPVSSGDGAALTPEASSATSWHPLSNVASSLGAIASSIENPLDKLGSLTPAFPPSGPAADITASEVQRLRERVPSFIQTPLRFRYLLVPI